MQSNRDYIYLLCVCSICRNPSSRLPISKSESLRVRNAENRDAHTTCKSHVLMKAINGKPGVSNDSMVNIYCLYCTRAVLVPLPSLRELIAWIARERKM